MLDSGTCMYVAHAELNASLSTIFFVYVTPVKLIHSKLFYIFFYLQIYYQLKHKFKHQTSKIGHKFSIERN